MTKDEVREWIIKTRDQMSQWNTYIGEYVPFGKRVSLGYSQEGGYRMDNWSLFVYSCKASKPVCYYLIMLEGQPDGAPDKVLCAYLQAESLIPFLVHFKWQMTWNHTRMSFRNAIPEREEAPARTNPVWFSPISVGYQTIWYTTDKSGEVYMETLLWRENGLPLVDDYKLFENLGEQVREILL